MAQAKIAAKWTINTLSEYDYAMVVQFNDEANSEDTHLLQMNPLNRARLKAYIDELEPHGGTNFEAGFKTAFDIVSITNFRSCLQFWSDCGRASRHPACPPPPPHPAASATTLTLR